jgi:hypothetical protein
MPVCRSCGSQIVWGETENKRLAPFDPDGTNHFVTCKDRRIWRRQHGTELPADTPRQQSFLDDDTGSE